MMEFTNVNKRFSLKNLLSSYEELNFPLFEKQRKQLINLGNMSLFIYGNKDEEIEKSLPALNLGSLPSCDNFQWFCCKPVDPYLLQNAHIVSPGNENLKVIGINICSGQTKANLASKLFIADIFSNIIDPFKTMVQFDAFDTAILTEGLDVSFVRKRLDAPNIQSFQNAQLLCKNQYCQLALEQPESFCSLCAQRRFWGLYMPEYLNKFLASSYEKFEKIIQNSDILFKEAEVLIVEGAAV